jgi:hypothetical protein
MVEVVEVDVADSRLMDDGGRGERRNDGVWQWSDSPTSSRSQAMVKKTIVDSRSVMTETNGECSATCWLDHNPR